MRLTISVLSVFVFINACERSYALSIINKRSWRTGRSVIFSASSPLPSDDAGSSDDTPDAVVRTEDDCEFFSVVIGKGSMLNLEGDGNLTFSDSLLVEGVLFGNLKCTAQDQGMQEIIPQTMIKIGTDGELHADVKCVSHVEVCGKLIGDVFCQTLVVAPGAAVVGDITARIISIGEGSSISGSVRTGAFSPEFNKGETIPEVTPIVQEEVIQEEIEVFEVIEEKPITTSTETKPSNPIQTVNKVPPETILDDDIDRSQKKNGARQVSVYHKIMQEAALKKGRAALFGRRGNVTSDKTWSEASRDTSDDLFDDFGNSIAKLDRARGKYVDSFGNPLIRGADDQQVASFRSIRHLSKETRAMLDHHRLEKEREDIQRMTSRKGEKSSDKVNGAIKKNKENGANKVNSAGGDDDDPIPSFLR